MILQDLLKLNLQLFAEEGEGAGDQASEEQLGEDKSGTDTDKQLESKTFTQDDVNNIAAREAKKAQEKLFKELGIEDFENAKEGMQKFQAWQESQKTETQKQTEKLEQLEKSHADVRSENQSLKAQLSALSVGVNVDSVEDVVALAERLVSDEVSMEDAIKQVTEKYPHFASAKEEPETGKPKFLSSTHQTNSESTDVFEALKNKYK